MPILYRIIYLLSIIIKEIIWWLLKIESYVEGVAGRSMILIGRPKKNWVSKFCIKWFHKRKCKNIRLFKLVNLIIRLLMVKII